MNLISIDDPDDPRVAPYRDIRERDLVGRDGMFIAEGEVVLRSLLGPGSRFEAHSILVAANRLDLVKTKLSPARTLPVYLAGQSVLDRIAGFPVHRGLLGIGQIGTPLSAAAMLHRLAPRALVVVAMGIANADNLGGIIRNAAAFGADGLLLDGQCCNPLYRKAIRVSVGTALTLPFARLRSDEDALSLLAAAGFDTIALSPGGRRELSEVYPSARMALVLGAEGTGLPTDVLARAEAVRISMVGAIDSLNVAVTSGIALHHLRSERRSALACPGSA